VDDENNLSRMDYDLAGMFRDRFPEIKYLTPMRFLSASDFILKLPENENFITVENVLSVENDFFRIFPLDFLAGDPANPFNPELSVIVTESVAEKLFGRTDIVGKQISTFRGLMPISAVVRDVPENSSFKADMILNSDTEIKFGSSCRNGNEICYNPYAIYALLNESTDIRLLEEKINANFPENKSETNKIRLQPLTEVYFDKTIPDNDNLPGNRSLVFVFMTIAIVILTLSVINYVNFALSQQLDTLKQLGVKMTYGASIKQLRSYYLVEIGLSVILSFILSLIIGLYFLPVFDNILGVHLDIKHILTPVFILSILSVLAIVVLVSSLTPFYIISKYDVQMLFGKKQTYFGKQRGKMILTGCQMGITVVMFICLFMLQKQLDYMKNYDLGFEKDHLLKIEIPHEGYEAFMNEISQYHFVQNMAYSGGTPGTSSYTEEQPVEQSNRMVTVNKIYSEPNFIETFDIKLLQGRNFTNADRGNSCIVSEEVMKQMEWDTFEGKKCNGYQVIGIIRDINTTSLHHRIEPVNIIFADEGRGPVDCLNVRFTGDIAEAVAQLRQSWKKVYPDTIFEYYFYNEVFDAYYKKEERQSTAIAIISFVAIIITCMGLIGQVKQTSLSKAKEIGIRKINGATIVEMMLVIPKNFLKSFAVAFVFAIPIAWIAMDKWLENFAFKTAISWWIFALSGVVVFMILTSFILW
jgi:putative ABC transport system permease protein